MFFHLLNSFGVLFGVISQCRYNNSAKLVKSAVESGSLGKIISARSVLTWTRPDTYYSESDWKGTWEFEGGGVVIDQAIHSKMDADLGESDIVFILSISKLSGIARLLC